MRSSPRPRGPRSWNGLLRLHSGQRENGALYVGHAGDPARRIWEHKTGGIPGFTSRYGVKTLVWYEQFETRDGAFARKRTIKRWNRAWRIELIEASNLWWRDLYDELQP